MKTIELLGRIGKKLKQPLGIFTMVDDADYEWLNQWRWNVSKYNHTSYAVRTIIINNKKIQIKMHRIILALTDNKIFGEHKDRNGLNNQRCNLRKATSAQNSVNKSPRGHSGFLGVSICRTLKKGKEYLYWRANISANKKPIDLGTFKNEKEAARAYDEAAKIYHGEFANLNFK